MNQAASADEGTQNLNLKPAIKTRLKIHRQSGRYTSSRSKSPTAMNNAG
jgi:hypothetical protein